MKKLFEVHRVVKNRVVAEKKIVVIERRKLWFNNLRVVVERRVLWSKKEKVGVEKTEL